MKNADAAFARAIKAGASVLMPLADQFCGFRSASVRDPFGHQWIFQHQQEIVSPEEMQKRWDAMSSKGESGGTEQATEAAGGDLTRRDHGGSRRGRGRQRGLALRDVHDQAGGEIEARGDRIDQHVFGVRRVRVKAVQA